MTSALPGWRRAAPAVVSAVLATTYVIWSPRSLDLAAALTRVKLFDAEGLGLWSNWWYGGHYTPGYSVLLGPVGAALGPQLAAAIAAVATAALFELLAHARFGERAWIGAMWFAAGTSVNLFTGRLTFALGLLPAVAAVLALARGHPRVAIAMCVLTALASPVAALFTALAGLAYAMGGRDGGDRRSGPRAPGAMTRIAIPGVAMAFASLAPIVIIAIAFPEGGTEPFAFSALWPIPVIAVVLLATGPRDARTLRAGIVLYTIGCVIAYAVPTAVGGNATRLGALAAGPVAALMLWGRRPAVFLALLIPLLYLQVQAPVRDVAQAESDPATTAGYYRPLLAFLRRQRGAPFRIEIPFTADHWEAYEVAPYFPLARGWERQLDTADNSLFYTGTLTPARYHAWLRSRAVRFVAVADAALDYSGRGEAALIEHGLPYLRLAWRSRHWRVYAVSDAAPLVQGAALRALGPESVTIDSRRSGNVYIHVRYTPYWALAEGQGCVAPEGDFTRVALRRAGKVKLVVRFALGRIQARSPRCP